MCISVENLSSSMPAMQACTECVMLSRLTKHSCRISRQTLSTKIHSCIHQLKLFQTTQHLSEMITRLHATGVLSSQDGNPILVNPPSLSPDREESAGATVLRAPTPHGPATLKPLSHKHRLFRTHALTFVSMLKS